MTALLPRTGSPSRSGARATSIRLALILAGLAGSPAAAQEAPPPAPPAPASPPAPSDAPKDDPAAKPPEKARRANPGLRAGDGAAREVMWAAPDAEDWKKPCLLTFQRTWDDAQAIAKETGRPILICVNMDGEPASEHYAGLRYRQPEVAPFYEPYVLVMASVYRHTPRDHDDEGHRILCPRFGSVTCGEHIAIEPVLYEKFFDGTRVAPRHILVELDGKESFDIFYANDTATVFQAIDDGIANRAALPPVVRGDRPVLERVASRDVRDRDAVEKAYRDGDEAQRRALLEEAAKNPDAAPTDLVRLAVFGFDPDLSRKAREALVKTQSPSAVNLVADALKVPMSEAERDALIATLARLGESSTRARWLAVVNQGLTNKGSTVDVKGWADAGAAYAAPAAAEPGAAEKLRDAKIAELREKPQDAATRLAFAESCIDAAKNARALTDPEDPKAHRMYLQQMIDDARISGLEAEKGGAEPWRVHSVLALAAYFGGNRDEAYARSESAARTIPPGEPGWRSMAALTVFAESRFRSIKDAVKAKKRWPSEWLADLNATYTILLRHPHGTAAQVAWHCEFLEWLGANDQAALFAEKGLARFPADPQLHERLRRRLLAEKGPDGLEAAYAEKLAAKDAPAGTSAFAGRAFVVAANFRRRAGDRAKAVETLGRAIDAYERAAAEAPDRRAPHDREAALALSMRSRLHYELQDDAKALADVLASFSRSPSTAGSRDAAGFTPGENAQMLLARFIAKKDDAAIESLQGALGKIDPELLRPDRRDDP